MQASTRAFIKRGGAACAAAAVLLGGSFTVATAAPSNEPAPAPAVSVEATLPATSETPAVSSSATPLPEGLAEAVERDLNLSVEEFNAQGELAAAASEVQAAAVKADPNAQVSVSGDTIKVQASPAAAVAAKTAASSAKISVASAPAAPLSAKANAANVDALFADYVAEFGTSNLQSIMVNGSGEFVIRSGEPAQADTATGGTAMKTRTFSAAATPTVSDFAAKYGNVKLEAASGPATAYASDVTNGQGYLAVDNPFTKGGACSIGWNGFNKVGAPAIVTAGHCTVDGALTDTYLTDPQLEPAVTEDLKSGGVLGPLGSFGVSQFGGPGNSVGVVGTDVAVINNLDPALNQLAKVTDWTTPADPKASGPQVTGISDAIVGMPICKSGRTTGWSCGNVAEVGVFLVAGTTYPDEEAACAPGATVPECGDIRAVRGFGSTNLEASQGDSGGAIIAGDGFAVGMISAGSEGKTYGVSLKDALAHTDGYTVKIFLETPAVTTTDPVYREGAVTGTVAGAPAGTTVAVTIDGVETVVPVGADGKWTAKAPNKFGTFSVTAQTKNGFSTSETTEASIEVIKETLAVPAITAPANDGIVAAPVTVITGTGKAGATLELTGDVTGTAVVGADGKWTFTVTPGLEVGPYTVTAKQTLTDWNDSTNTTSKFTVVPAAPAVTTPSNGQEFAFDQGPTAISGTNIAGATLTVTLNGKAQTVTVVDGTWSVALDAKLATGKYTLTAVQAVDGVDSLTTTSAFTVLAEPKPEPTTPPVTEEPTPSSPAPSEAPTQAPSDNDLANTGASSSMLVLGGAGGLLLLAGSVFLLIRRRNTAA